MPLYYQTQNASSVTGENIIRQPAAPNVYCVILEPLGTIQVRSKWMSVTNAQKENLQILMEKVNVKNA